ncbi:MAG: hypothetical protein ABIG44_17845 [Planctomycetota bacterium]
MNYWLNLFTGNTWEEFQAAGSKVSGFRQHNWKRAGNIRPGDVFLSYMVGVKRWVGLLEVTGARFKDDSAIYKEEVFPVRFPVKALVTLKPEHGVPMESFAGKLSFYPAGVAGKHWSGYVRSSPTKYKREDGDTIAAAIREAAANPVERPVDPKKLARSANLYKLKAKAGNEEIETVVSVPAVEEEVPTPADSVKGPTHSEIQWRLLDLGTQLGLNVWAPKADRGKTWNGQPIGDLPTMLATLPTQFDEVTNKTIENIDVLWLSGQAIVAAFEVEHTTSIYSGLLRMSDLLTMQPNLDIKLYLVGPDERQPKFENEVARATFASRKKPLHSMCSFLPYSCLCQRLEEAKNVIAFLRPEFLDEIAISYDPADEVDA